MIAVAWWVHAILVGAVAGVTIVAVTWLLGRIR